MKKLAAHIALLLVLFLALSFVYAGIASATSGKGGGGSGGSGKSHVGAVDLDDDDDNDRRGSNRGGGIQGTARPFEEGEFKAKGIVTALSASTSTTSSSISLNGLAMDSTGARVEGRGIRSLLDAMVGDRAEVKGEIRNGSIRLQKIEVMPATPRPLPPPTVREDVLRSIQNQIQSILERINELFRRLGSTSTATSTSL